MGLGFFKPSGCGCEPLAPAVTEAVTEVVKTVKDVISKPKSEAWLGQPNPKNFLIEKTQQEGQWCIVQVRYPDADNYEGKKILLYKAKSADIWDQDILDPHFCEGDHLSPFARFEPTEEGWAAAISLAKNI